ncbi:MAG: hypothetical protein ACLVL7_04170 [Anaerotruncus massiliensis (ex Togo et al. 2019)]
MHGVDRAEEARGIAEGVEQGMTARLWGIVTLKAASSRRVSARDASSSGGISRSA